MDWVLYILLESELESELESDQNLIWRRSGCLQLLEQEFSSGFLNIWVGNCEWFRAFCSLKNVWLCGSPALQLQSEFEQRMELRTLRTSWTVLAARHLKTFKYEFPKWVWKCLKSHSSSKEMPSNRLAFGLIGKTSAPSNGRHFIDNGTRLQSATWWLITAAQESWVGSLE